MYCFVFGQNLNLQASLVIYPECFSLGNKNVFNGITKARLGLNFLQSC